jgi:hypothetical protein
MGDLIRPINGRDAGAWLRKSMTTFGIDVGSILPDLFEAYARIDHPEGDGRRDGCLPRGFVEPLIEHLRPATATPDQCFFGVWEGYGVGTTFIRFERGTSWWQRMKARRELAKASRPPEWKTSAPTLELPARNYHVFTGPIEGASFDLSASPHDWVWQSANLWWPTDHAWCVATEIDFSWTYVGASRQCVDAILSDSRLGASETTARSRLQPS